MQRDKAPINRGKLSAQTQRRSDLLLRQKHKRREAWSVARLVDDADNTMTDQHNQAEQMDSNEHGGEQQVVADDTENYAPPPTFASMMMLPEWMVELPSDLNSKCWFVLPRPRGIRCLVIARRGLTTARTKHNRILKCHPSCLPNGSRATGMGSETTVLDCFFDAELSTYHVLDVLCWNGFEFHECPAELRFFWFRSKLSETPHSDSQMPRNPIKFCPIPCFDCSLPGFDSVYQHAVSTNHNQPALTDGILFFNKQGFYTPGLCPLVLLWMDSATSSRFEATVSPDAPTSLLRHKDAPLFSKENITHAIHFAEMEIASHENTAVPSDDTMDA